MEEGGGEEGVYGTGRTPLTERKVKVCVERSE